VTVEDVLENSIGRSRDRTGRSRDMNMNMNKSVCENVVANVIILLGTE